MVQLTYLGHSAFSIRHDGHLVLVDPFLSGNPAASAAAEDFSPETILLTHAHNDHVGDTVGIATRARSTVIATHELANWLNSQGVEGAVGGNHGGTIAFAGGTAKFVPAWHTSSYSSPEGVVAPGVPAGLVVRIGTKTLYFAGDTCLFGDMKLIGEEGLDVAVVPIGDHFTMGINDAIRSVSLLEPELVIPCHYNTFPAITQDAAAFKAGVESRTSSNCEPLEPGESITL